MPVYEYRCVGNAYHALLQVTRPINDPAGEYSCEECGSAVERSFSQVGVQFKGTGFYKTDNGTK